MKRVVTMLSIAVLACAVLLLSGSTFADEATEDNLPSDALPGDGDETDALPGETKETEDPPLTMTQKMRDQTGQYAEVMRSLNEDFERLYQEVATQKKQGVGSGAKVNHAERDTQRQRTRALLTQTAELLDRFLARRALVNDIFQTLEASAEVRIEELRVEVQDQQRELKKVEARTSLSDERRKALTIRQQAFVDRFSARIDALNTKIKEGGTQHTNTDDLFFVIEMERKMIGRAIYIIDDACTDFYEAYDRLKELVANFAALGATLGDMTLKVTEPDPVQP